MASLIIESVTQSCAVNGYHDALAMLLRHVVDARDVLHDLVEESVEQNGKLDKLIGSYEVIVDGYRRSTAGELSIVDTGCRPKSLRAAVLRLVGESRHGKNVIERKSNQTRRHADDNR
jgi:hypothetical protein